MRLEPMSSNYAHFWHKAPEINSVIDILSSLSADIIHDFCQHNYAIPSAIWSAAWEDVHLKEMDNNHSQLHW